MNILLTGSTGFIGSNLLNKLKINNKIFITVRGKKRNNLMKHKNIRIISFNNFNQLNEKLRKIRVDIIIHAATHYNKSHSYTDLKKFSESNILFGNIILENIKKLNVKKFINFSTTWEDYNGIKNNYYNLYSAYKKAFSIILNYYKINLKNVKFYELMISDTFGNNDKRPKLINVLRSNYKNSVKTKLVSKNLSINLLNVEDIVQAVSIILKKNINPNKYLLKNNKNFKISEIIQRFNKINTKKIKVTWSNNKLIKEKSLPYNQLKSWKPRKSNIMDVINIIKK